MVKQSIKGVEVLAVLSSFSKNSDVTLTQMGKVQDKDSCTNLASLNAQMAFSPSGNFLYMEIMPMSLVRPLMQPNESES